MDYLGNNVWMVLTDIIYKIHSIHNIDKMRSILLKQLQWVIPFDRATSYLASGEQDLSLCSPITLNFPDEYVKQYLEHYYQYDYSRGIKISANNIVYLDSDICDEKVWLKSTYYEQICQPNSIRHIIHINLAFDNTFLGVLSLYRSETSINFSYRDSFILNQLKDHLALRLHTAYLAKEQTSTKLSTFDCSIKFQLTAREERVLSLMAKGFSTEEMCSALIITPNTLKKHIMSIYKKLGIKNRIQLLKMIQE
ncbi:regulatory protein, luxR family [Propionispira arboris]|uniref:Regulatory protein, luxR family n=1 Tax=Propionispira arboris TaxID=84035 RepID=A0A1H6ZDZ3_9FIRM|nr:MULTISPECIES: LuxR C-terminal-related transcriptional regulator [Propionispira]SEJ47085.1 regulatory protein, luxR family [Propionispira arboris]